MSDWDNQRAKLNHDLLKNQVLPTLDRLKRIAEGRISGDGLMIECCDHLNLVWCELYIGLKVLLNRSRIESGMCSWLTVPPLNKLDEHDAKWMYDLLLSHQPNSHEAITKQFLVELTTIDYEIKQLASRIILECSSREYSSAINDESTDVEIDYLKQIIHIRKHVSNLSETLSSMSYNKLIQNIPRVFFKYKSESSNKNKVSSNTSSLSVMR